MKSKRLCLQHWPNYQITKLVVFPRENYHCHKYFPWEINRVGLKGFYMDLRHIKSDVPTAIDNERDKTACTIMISRA